MVVEPEEAAIPDGRNIVGEIRAQKTLIEDRNSSFGQWVKLAFDPSDTLCQWIRTLFEHLIAFAVSAQNGVHAEVLLRHEVIHSESRIPCW